MPFQFSGSIWKSLFSRNLSQTQVGKALQAKCDLFSKKITYYFSPLILQIIFTFDTHHSSEEE